MRLHPMSKGYLIRTHCSSELRYLLGKPWLAKLPSASQPNFVGVLHLKLIPLLPSPVRWFRASGEIILVWVLIKAEAPVNCHNEKSIKAGRVHDRLSPNAPATAQLLIYTLSRLAQWWGFIPESVGKPLETVTKIYLPCRLRRQIAWYPLVIDQPPSCGASHFGWSFQWVSQDKSMGDDRNDEEMDEGLALDISNDWKNECDRRDFKSHRVANRLALCGWQSPFRPIYLALY